MKLIIAGSSEIQDEKFILRRIQDLIMKLVLDVTEIVSGCAPGPDTFGENYASTSDIIVKQMPANRSAHGNAAGPIRNRKMSEYGDIAFVFWNGESTGSLNMISEMNSLGKPCLVEIIK